MTHLEAGSECGGRLLYVLCFLFCKVALSLFIFELGLKDPQHLSSFCFPAAFSHHYKTRRHQTKHACAFTAVGFRYL